MDAIMFVIVAGAIGTIMPLLKLLKEWVTRKKQIKMSIEIGDAKIQIDSSNLSTEEIEKILKAMELSKIENDSEGGSENG